MRSSEYEELSFRADQPFWEFTEVDDRMELRTRRGLLGFHVVDPEYPD